MGEATGSVAHTLGPREMLPLSFSKW
ncbi:uncharacterized protein G2W53_005970 [Senna tora]|uniref:Uncharacterized protein n=1 Tax=Senna tora TaxID=362788 RepID=A0A834X2X0_9FABA|nr:uncharacterized protein G2W53_005970 [Senna tora]